MEMGAARYNSRVIYKIYVQYSCLIPRFDSPIDMFSGASIFSKLDLRSGYCHVKIGGDEWKTTCDSKDGYLAIWRHSNPKMISG